MLIKYKNSNLFFDYTTSVRSPTLVSKTWSCLTLVTWSFLQNQTAHSTGVINSEINLNIR